MRKKFIYGLFVFSLLWSCKTAYDLPPKLTNLSWRTKTIPPHPQSTGGDPDSGFYYLVEGAYLGTGLPYELLQKRIERNPEKFLRKARLASPYSFAVFETEHGVDVMNGTCFSCHTGKVNGETILGLGNSMNSNQTNLTLPSKLMNWNVRRKYRKDTATIASYDNFGKFFSAMAPYTYTNNPGVNSAARIAESCMRFRDPVDLTYTEEPQYEIRDYNLGSDIPALWHLQKKNALYYTGVGRGDFTKLLFQASVLGIKDSTAARSAQQKFVHITSWIQSLEPPAYPKSIDQNLAALGKDIFMQKCKGCHGTYDEPETYPNKIVALDLIGTDPLYAEYASDSKIVDWYNRSWFATSEPISWFEPEQGYIAPPLDGIWATAPYLHNGSVPTIYEVLNSKARPQYWKRPKDGGDYDWKKVGWDYKAKNRNGNKLTYDTTLPGYGNQGHTFADTLSDDNRWALIEYLKTL